MADEAPPAQDPIAFPSFEEDMDIHDLFTWPKDVPKLPMEELTPDQRQKVMDSYRFSGFRPGMYQGVTFVSKGGQMPS